MARVGDGQGTVVSDERCAAGDEAADLPAEDAVEVGEHVGGPTLLRVTQGADDGAYGHGGLETFAADVADDDEERPVVAGEDLEEIASYLLCGHVNTFDREAGGGRWRGGNQQRLDGLGRFEFRGQAFLFLACQREAAHKKHQQRENKKIVDQLAHAEWKGTL